MTPGDHVRAGRGDVDAIVVAGSGERITFRELDERSMQLARRLRAHGLRPGGRVAALLENHPRWFEVVWATQRSGLHLVPVNWHLDAAEAGAVVQHAGATALVTSAALADVARAIGARRLADVTLRLVVDGEIPGYERYEDAVAGHVPRPLEVEPQGEIMFYSSGTSGPPKAILPALSGASFGERPNGLAALMQVRWGFGPDSTFLTVGPMYHAGPLGFSVGAQRLGGTVVLAEDFDARRVLELVEEHAVTHLLLFPVHLRALADLGADVRARFDTSSLRTVIHGTSPCPVHVKQQLMDWWGPILHEYYVGAEGNAFTLATPQEWLERPGTVGRLLTGELHILDEQGVELPPGETGQIWFETGVQFEYHDDPGATAAACNDRGWTTLGDVGHVDEDGWLYVDGRAEDAITTAWGVVHPLRIEHVLDAHPAVADVAVVGAQGPGGAARVVALVVPAVGGDDLVDRLREHCCAGLPASHRPDRIELVDQLPRLPTGKLLKRRLPTTTAL